MQSSSTAAGQWGPHPEAAPANIAIILAPMEAALESVRLERIAVCALAAVTNVPGSRYSSTRLKHINNPL